MSILCLFDLDRTLLAGRTLHHLAKAFHKQAEVEQALEPPGPSASVAESKRIMRIFRGADADRFEDHCRTPLHPQVEQVGRHLRRRGCITAVVTAGYRAAAAEAATKLGARHIAALEPEVTAGHLTGKLRASPWQGSCGRMICKAIVLEHLAKMERPRFTVAVGDGTNDICMFQKADLAIAVGDAHPGAVANANVGPVDLGQVPDIITRYMPQPDVEPKRGHDAAHHRAPVKQLHPTQGLR